MRREQEQRDYEERAEKAKFEREKEQRDYEERAEIAKLEREEGARIKKEENDRKYNLICRTVSYL